MNKQEVVKQILPLAQPSQRLKGEAASAHSILRADKAQGEGIRPNLQGVNEGGERALQRSQRLKGEAHAPSNIALIKYWGKRNSTLNLPNTDSLSISLGNFGTTTLVQFSSWRDHYFLNGQKLDNTCEFAQRLQQFLNLFRPAPDIFYQVETHNNIPTAAGLASSASGFAALVLALHELHDWQLSQTQLSILARLGSGSACRSLWHGFVQWQQGIRSDGMDSHGVPLPIVWPELRIGLLIFSTEQKPLSSRIAMQRTLETSTLYQTWPQQVANDLTALRPALSEKNFPLLGKIAENNALAMHATMEDSTPPVVYSTTDTLQARETVWQCRADGIDVFFTQDAGPNLKLLFLAQQQSQLLERFPHMHIVNPFDQKKN